MEELNQPQMMEPSMPEMDSSNEAPTEPGRPWGFWATMGFTLAIMCACLTAQVIVVSGVMIVMSMIRHMSPSEMQEVAGNGLTLALCTIATAPIAVGLSVLFAYLRRQLAVWDYLGMKWPPTRQIIQGCVSLVLLVVGMDCLSYALGRPIVSEFMIQIYQTAGFMPLLVVAIVVAAPLGEEFVFRGFLFEGLARSRAGGTGAVLVSSAVWTLIHIQYNTYEMLTVFTGGLLLGYFRLRTGSIWLCIVLHMLMNIIAFGELIVWTWLRH
jgi:membrane protease YdiL (CAAX protease family)